MDTDGNESEWVTESDSSSVSREDDESKIAVLEARLANSDSEQFKIRHDLAELYMSKYERLDDVENLKTALTHYREAVRLQPGDAEYLLELGICYSLLFEEYGGEEDINNALHYVHACLDNTPVDHPDIPGRAQALASTYRRRFDKLNDLDAIDAAIKWDERATEKMPKGHPDTPLYLQSLGDSYMRRFDRLGELPDLVKCLQAYSAAVKAAKEDDPLCHEHHSNLAIAYRERFNMLSVSQDINLAIQHNFLAISKCSPGTISYADYCSNLAMSYRDKFQAFGNPDDLESALKHDQMAVTAAEKGGFDPISYQQSLSASYIEKFNAFSDTEAVEIALVLSKNIALNTNDADRIEYADAQGHLGVCYLYQHEISGKIEFLTLAIDCFERQLRVLPAKHPDLANVHKHMGVCHSGLYESEGKLSDLLANIDHTRLALSATVRGSLEYSNLQRNLSVALQEKFLHAGDMNDLALAIEHSQTAIVEAPSQATSIPGHKHTLARAYLLKFERYGDQADLDVAIENLQAACDATDPANAEYSDFLEGLADAYKLLFSRSQRLEDLETAIGHFEAALSIPASKPSTTILCKFGLGMSLFYRNTKVNNLDDLERALKLVQDAFDATSKKSPSLRGYHYGLALLYNEIYDKFTNEGDIESAIAHGKAAIEGLGDNHPELAAYKRNLSSSYTLRFLTSHGLDDATLSLFYDEAALSITPRDHADFPRHMQSLGVSYTNKYMISKDPKDLKSALAYKHAALESAKLDNPDIPDIQGSLAYSYLDQFYGTKNPEDLHCALYYLRRSIQPMYRRPQSLWDSAKSWAMNAYHNLLPECIEAFATAFRLLPDLLWIGNPISNRHSSLLQYDIPSMTMWAVDACIQFRELQRAVEFLEQGLSITHQQQLQLKDDYAILMEKYPSYAEEIKDISHRLQGGTNGSAKPPTSERVHSLAAKREQLIREVRAIPEFADFLLPMRYEKLCVVAKEGPVVMLGCTARRSDAIVVLPPRGELLHVPLPEVTASTAEEQLKKVRDGLSSLGIYSRQAASIRDTHAMDVNSNDSGLGVAENDFEAVTTWLWKCVVSQVYKALYSRNMKKGRLWWCPTGPFTYLPLHAAPPLKDDAFDHSYTPTLSALLNARQKYARSASANQPGVARITMVGVPELPDRPEKNLPGVEKEFERITLAVGKEHVRPLIGEQASVANVSSAILASQWMHIACHGEQDVNDPLASQLVLFDGELKLGQILDMYVPDARFVFLSACETAMGDSALINESLHLAGGMIFAGYCGAVGTMWSISDGDAPQLAGLVYKRIFQHDSLPDVAQVAHALHMAVRAMRRKGLPFHRWAPFIHLGI